MTNLYLFERNVFTAIFFTPLSQQVIRNHISEMEKSTKMRFFMKVYTQVGGEIWQSEGKNLGSKGPPRYIQPRPLTRRALAGLECIKKRKSLSDIPKIGNGLLHLLRMDKSTGQIWVKLKHSHYHYIVEKVIFKAI